MTPVINENFDPFFVVFWLHVNWFYGDFPSIRSSLLIWLITINANKLLRIIQQRQPKFHRHQRTETQLEHSCAVNGFISPAHCCCKASNSVFVMLQAPIRLYPARKASAINSVATLPRVNTCCNIWKFVTSSFPGFYLQWTCIFNSRNGAKAFRRLLLLMASDFCRLWISCEAWSCRNMIFSANSNVRIICYLLQLRHSTMC